MESINSIFEEIKGALKSHEYLLVERESISDRLIHGLRNFDYTERANGAKQLIGLQDQKNVSICIDLILILGLNALTIGSNPSPMSAEMRIRTDFGKDILGRLKMANKGDDNTLINITDWESLSDILKVANFDKNDVPAIKTTSYISEMTCKRILDFVLLNLLSNKYKLAEKCGDKSQILHSILKYSSTSMLFSAAFSICSFASVSRDTQLMSASTKLLAETLLREDGVESYLNCTVHPTEALNDDEIDRHVRVLVTKPRFLSMDDYLERICPQWLRFLTENSERKPLNHVKIISWATSRVFQLYYESARKTFAPLVLVFSESDQNEPEKSKNTILALTYLFEHAIPSPELFEFIKPALMHSMLECASLVDPHLMATDINCRFIQNVNRSFSSEVLSFVESHPDLKSNKLLMELLQIIL